MNTIEIGKYIKRKRIEMHLTQKDLAESLQISFQAVSKWETGSTLPDTSILLALSDVLEVTVDQILNAGEFKRKKMEKRVNVEEVRHAIKSILKIKHVLGPNNGIYKSMMSGLEKEAGEMTFLERLMDPEQREILVAKSCIQLVIDGYHLSDDDIEQHFENDMIKAKVKKIIKKYEN